MPCARVLVALNADFDTARERPSLLTCHAHRHYLLRAFEEHEAFDAHGLTLELDVSLVVPG